MFLLLYLCSFAICFEFNVLIDLITWYSQSGNKINHVLFTFVFTLFRSSHRKCFIKNAFLKNFAIFTWKRHTIKPGTPEHGTHAEQRNTGTRNNGTRNTSGIAGNHGTTAEYRNNRTTQKLEPEDKHGIFHYLQFSLDRKVIRAMDR